MGGGVSFTRLEPEACGAHDGAPERVGPQELPDQKMSVVGFLENLKDSS